MSPFLPSSLPAFPREHKRRRPSIAGTGEGKREALSRGAIERPLRRKHEARPQMKDTAAAVRSGGGLCLGRDGRADLRRCFIQLFAGRGHEARQGIVQAEAVAGESRDDVQMGVEHFLPRHGAIGKEEIDPFTADARPPKGRGDVPCLAGDDPAEDAVVVQRHNDEAFCCEPRAGDGPRRPAGIVPPTLAWLVNSNAWLGRLPGNLREADIPFDEAERDGLG